MRRESRSEVSHMSHMEYNALYSPPMQRRTPTASFPDGSEDGHRTDLSLEAPASRIPVGGLPELHMHRARALTQLRHNYMETQAQDRTELHQWICWQWTLPSSSNT